MSKNRYVQNQTILFQLTTHVEVVDMTLVRYYPTARFPYVRNNELFRGYDHSEVADWEPRADVIEREDAYEVSVELPGVDKDAVEVTFEKNTLTITGKREAENDENARYYRRERRYGTFRRSFRVPERGVDGDKVRAAYNNGVLTLTLPKAVEVLPKKIEVTG